MALTTRRPGLEFIELVDEKRLNSQDGQANVHLLSDVSPPDTCSLSPKAHQHRVESAVQKQMYFFMHALLCGYVSLHLRVHHIVSMVRCWISSILFSNNQTLPQICRDVSNLEKRPQHISAVLGDNDRCVGADIRRLIDEAADFAIWCASAEIPLVSVYEKTGTLKENLSHLHDAVTRRLVINFGDKHPILSVTSPQSAECSWSDTDSDGCRRLHIRLISAEDGRDAIVNLTREFARDSQVGHLSVVDVSHRLIERELSRRVLSEPDLIIIFKQSIVFSGYPPWQLRLPEIYHLQAGESFGYQAFLRALRKYGKAQMRYGK